MAVSKAFMEAVQNGNLLRIHIILKDSLIVDPSAVEFNEMENYAIDKLGDIYVDHDGEILNSDQAFWTEDYLNEQMVNVVDNFSKERVNLLKNMVRYLYRDRIKPTPEPEPEPNDTPKNFGRRQIGMGVTAAGAVLAVAGLCTSHTALTVGGVAVAVAGVALIISDR